MDELVGRLPSLGVARISGNDAVSFMQAHFCNDVEQVVPGRVQLSGYCSPKGRLLAVFHLGHVVDESGEAFLLVAPRSVLKPMLDRLSMFAKMARPAGKEMFAQVTKTDIELRDCSDELEILGIAGSSTINTLSKNLDFEPEFPAIGGTLNREQLAVLAPPGWQAQQPLSASSANTKVAAATNSKPERLLCIGTPERIADIESTLTAADGSAATTIDEERWQLEDIRAGIPVVLPETLDQFVPQMANMHRLEGLSFTKGCYPGQEIVARMQYLGKLKRRTERFVFAGDALQPGTPVHDAAGAEAGVVMASAATDGAGEALIVVRIASSSASLVASGVGDASVQLSAASLPYSIDDIEESSA